MVLNLGSAFESLFPHSKRLEQGGGKVRFCQGTYVVSKDGTGDYSSVKDALDDISSSGGCVYIKEGIYLEPALTLSSNVSLIGSGMSTIIRAKSGVSNLITIGSSSANVVIENIRFDGQHVSGSTAIFADSSIFGQKNVIRNCFFISWNFGLRFANIYSWLVCGNIFDDCFVSIKFTGECYANSILNNLNTQWDLFWSPQANYRFIVLDSTGSYYGCTFNDIVGNCESDCLGLGLEIVNTLDFKNVVVGNAFGNCTIKTLNSGGYNLISSNCSTFNLNTTDEVGHNISP